VFDIYLAWSLPSFTEPRGNWAWFWALQRIYGEPRPGGDPTLKPRMVYVLNLRVLGLMLGMSISHTCAKRDIRVAAPQQ